jgi:hypothetical protein
MARALAHADLERGGWGIKETSARSTEARGVGAGVGTAMAVCERKRSHEVSMLIGGGTGEGWCFG